jgi:hypothetical protein
LYILYFGVSATAGTTQLGGREQPEVELLSSPSEPLLASGAEDAW